MKRIPKNQGPGTAPSKVALATAIAALPLTVGPALQAQVREAVDQPVPTQSPRNVSPALTLDLCCLKFADRYMKQEASYTIVGTDNEHTIYQNARNEYFYLDPETGDMKFLAPDVQLKMREGAARSATSPRQRTFKTIDFKHGGQVTILGLDEAGHVVQRNARGETFYLDPSTGDMVFAK